MIESKANLNDGAAHHGADDNDACIMRMRPSVVLPARLADFFYSRWQSGPKNRAVALPFGFSGDSHAAAMVSRICGPGRLPATAWGR